MAANQHNFKEFPKFQRIIEIDKAINTRDFGSLVKDANEISHFLHDCKCKNETVKGNDDDKPVTCLF